MSASVISYYNIVAVVLSFSRNVTNEVYYLERGLLVLKPWLNRYSAVFLSFVFISSWGVIDYLIEIGLPISPHISHIVLYGIMLTIGSIGAWYLGYLHEQVYKAAIIDPLTKLFNKRYFYDTSEQLIKLAKKTGAPLTFAVVDVDRFKDYNDTYGHLAGDDALKTIAASFNSHIRKQDIVARFGGDEFIFLFPFTKVDEATKIMERINLSIHKAVDYTVGVSIGIASFPEDGKTVKELLYIADKNMYCCKRMPR